MKDLSFLRRLPLQRHQMLEVVEPLSDLTFGPLQNAYQVGLVYDNVFHGWQGPYFRTWARLREKSQTADF